MDIQISAVRKDKREHGGGDGAVVENNSRGLCIGKLGVVGAIRDSDTGNPYLGSIVYIDTWVIN